MWVPLAGLHSVSTQRQPSGNNDHSVIRLKHIVCHTHVLVTLFTNDNDRNNWVCLFSKNNNCFCLRNTRRTKLTRAVIYLNKCWYLSVDPGHLRANIEVTAWSMSEPTRRTEHPYSWATQMDILLDTKTLKYPPADNSMVLPCLFWVLCIQNQCFVSFNFLLTLFVLVLLADLHWPASISSSPFSGTSSITDG